jgi:hypothetical protein
MNKPYTQDERDAARKRLIVFTEKWHNDNPGSYHWYPEDIDASVAIDLQCALTRALSSGWVKIEPGCKMPEPGTRCVVLAADEPEMLFARYEIYFWWGTSGESIDCRDATHYMLIAPPEEGQ